MPSSRHRWSLLAVTFLLISAGIHGQQTGQQRSGFRDLTPEEASQIAATVPRIQFGGISLQLGESKEQALEELSRSFIVAQPEPTRPGTPVTSTQPRPFGPASDRSTWVIYEKQAPSYLRGYVTFADGKVEEVVKDWLLVESDGSASDVVDAIYGLFNQLVSEQRSSCTVVPALQTGAGAQIKIASLTCGRKHASISVTTETGRSPSVSVHEEIR
jgi:hypothetical protein